MEELKYVDLLVSWDKSEVAVVRRAELHKPEGFTAHFGAPIRFSHEDFFGNCSKLIQGFLDEDLIWHDPNWPDVGLCEIDQKPRSPALRKYLKKFKLLSVVKGGYNPDGITVVGYDDSDEIRFTFKEGESADVVTEMFREALERCHWWEK